MLAGAVCGFANGLAITKLQLPPFIVTLGMLGITFGLGEVIDGGSYLPAPVPPGLSSGFGAGKFLGIFYPIWRRGRRPARRAHRLPLHALRPLHARGRLERGGDAPRRHRRRLARRSRSTRSPALAGVAAVVDLAIYTNTTSVSHRTDNLAAISAVVIGGTSLFGGVGTS